MAISILIQTLTIFKYKHTLISSLTSLFSAIESLKLLFSDSLITNMNVLMIWQSNAGMKLAYCNRISSVDCMLLLFGWNAVLEF